MSLKTLFKSIADAIRAKKGTIEVIPAESFADEISSIETASEPILQEKSVEITENTTTTYTADEGFDGLKSLEVTTNIASSGGEAEEWVRPADIEWARNVCINDVQEGKTAKILYLIGDDLPTTSIVVPTNGAVKTSDGAYYTANATHTWNDSGAYTPQTFTQYKKLRWLIFYGKENTLDNQPNFVIYKAYKNYGTINNTTCMYVAPYSLQYLDFISGTQFVIDSYGDKLTYSKNPFYGRKYLRAVDVKNGSGSTNYLFYGLGKLDKFKIELNQNYAFYKTTPFSSSFKPKHMEFICSYWFNYCCYGYQGKKIPAYANNKNAAQYGYAFANSNIENVSKEDLTLTHDNVSLDYAFSGCQFLKSVKLETSKVYKIDYIFSGCSSLEEIEFTDLSNVSSATGAFSNCSQLKNLKIKNIKVSLTIGSTNYYGELLTKESLINSIKELWDYSSDTSGTAYTLTMGSNNTTRLSNVYVKLITPTAEQIAEDPNIESKMPCEVCESTDDGAMLIRDYATLKGWTTA